MNLEQLKSTLIAYLQDAKLDTNDADEKIKIERVITTFSNLKPNTSFKVIKLTIECAFDLILTCSRPNNLRDLLNDYKKQQICLDQQNMIVRFIKKFFTLKRVAY